MCAAYLYARDPCDVSSTSPMGTPSTSTRESRQAAQMRDKLSRMTDHAFPELDSAEIKNSGYIMKMFDRVEEIQNQIDFTADIAEDSKLSIDFQRLPQFPVSYYIYTQITVASGCIAALKQMIVRENDDTATMTVGPFGAYALVRNSIDAAAVGMWIAEPESSTGRIKRRIQVEVDETKNAASFRESMGQPSTDDWKLRKRERLSELAGIAKLGTWDPLHRSNRLPATTDILKSLERHHSDAVLPWLSAWQLSSGHAHAKVWAQLASNDLAEVDGSRTETGATYLMTIKYGILAAVLLEAMKLLEATAMRYLVLARAPQPK